MYEPEPIDPAIAWMEEGNCRAYPPATFFPSDGAGVDHARRMGWLHGSGHPSRRCAAGPALAAPADHPGPRRSLVLSGVLAYQAQDAARSHRAASESALRDYAALASEEMARHLEDEMEDLAR